MAQVTDQAMTLGSGRDRAMRLVMKLVGAAHRRLYGITRGRIGQTVKGMPVLLLTTTGRKSGQPRAWPLGYLEDGENIVVIASAGGTSIHPSWYLNLRDHPAVTVHIGNRVETRRAETAGLEERQRLWTRLIASYPFFADYQRPPTGESRWSCCGRRDPWNGCRSAAGASLAVHETPAPPGSAAAI